jgi:hypothetical protein
MPLKVARVDTWISSLEDKPGSLAAKLHSLADAKISLEFVIARRAPERPGLGVVFVTPIVGAAKIKAARAAGFKKTQTLNAVRVEGKDQAGMGAKLTTALAAKDLNLRGLSGAALGGKFVAHIAFDSSAAAAKAVRILRSI